MKSAITICLVPEALSGPFVFHEGLRDGCQRAAALGFDAVEVFPSAVERLDTSLLKSVLDGHGLALAAMGTGAGWLQCQWTLTHEDANVRQSAQKFIRDIIDWSGPFGAPAIIGSLQGRTTANVSRVQTLEWLADACRALSDYSQSKYGVPLLVEPLNRYESNIFNRLRDVSDWCIQYGLTNVRILADLFHMNIEETDLAAAFQDAGSHVGHVHFADSNRRPMGSGHTVMKPIIEALQGIGYGGYLSAEIFPLPDSDTAARQTIEQFRKWTGDKRA